MFKEIKYNQEGGLLLRKEKAGRKQLLGYESIF